VICLLKNKIKKIGSVILAMILILVPSIAIAEMPITIDGYFDDWADKPHTPFYYGTYDDIDYENISLFSDDRALYAHIKMSDLDGRFDSFVMYLKINNTYDMQLIIMPTADKKEIDWSTSIREFPAGTHFDIAVFDNLDYSKVLGDAVLKIYDKNYYPGDDVEFSISFDDIASYCNNIPINEINNITFTCPSIGDQSLTLAGTSTVPFLGIIVTLSIMGIVLLYRKYKQTGKSI
jgi:uncharacterized protein (TIGR04145 family)